MAMCTSMRRRALATCSSHLGWRCLLRRSRLKVVDSLLFHLDTLDMDRAHRLQSLQALVVALEARDTTNTNTVDLQSAHSKTKQRSQ